ncbi:MAG: RNA polymerase sigma factor [Planctomycetota bacterium]|jgi:RNA polymerase sigma-70 factor (ECF subfamily)
MDCGIKSLCKRAKKGDKAAACELVKIYYQDIFAYLRRLCDSRQNAEDLTQETFVKAWSSFASFKNRSKFSTWLYRIAYNTCVDGHRRNSDSILSQSDEWWQEHADGNPNPLDKTEQQEMAICLYKSVNRLDDAKKHVVHLHYYQGLSLRETAAVLNISTATVKYRLREAIKILKGDIDSG